MGLYGDIPKARNNWAFFLDVDGTLIDIAPTPDAATATQETIAILDHLAKRFSGAIALVSGRPIADLDRIFAPLHLAAAGIHGLERRSADGRLTRALVSGAAIAKARAALVGLEDRLPGILVEDKGETIAIHFRRAPHHEAAVAAAANDIVAQSGGGLIVLAGKMLAELRPPGPNKGNVVTDFMGEPPFAGRVPVFIGDDVTDEDGFVAVNRLGGHSIRIGADETGAAHHHLRDVDHLRNWLNHISKEKSDDRS